MTLRGMHARVLIAACVATASSAARAQTTGSACDAVFEAAPNMFRAAAQAAPVESTQAEAEGAAREEARVRLERAERVASACVEDATIWNAATRTFDHARVVSCLSAWSRAEPAMARAWLRYLGAIERGRLLAPGASPVRCSDLDDGTIVVFPDGTFEAHRHEFTRRLLGLATKLHEGGCDDTSELAPFVRRWLPRGLDELLVTDGRADPLVWLYGGARGDASRRLDVFSSPVLVQHCLEARRDVEPAGELLRGAFCAMRGWGPGDARQHATSCRRSVSSSPASRRAPGQSARVSNQPRDGCEQLHEGLLATTDVADASVALARVVESLATFCQETSSNDVVARARLLRTSGLAVQAFELLDAHDAGTGRARRTASFLDEAVASGACGDVGEGALRYFDARIAADAQPRDEGFRRALLARARFHTSVGDTERAEADYVASWNASLGGAAQIDRASSTLGLADAAVARGDASAARALVQRALREVASATAEPTCDRPGATSLRLALASIGRMYDAIVRDAAQATPVIERELARVLRDVQPTDELWVAALVGGAVEHVANASVGFSARDAQHLRASLGRAFRGLPEEVLRHPLVARTVRRATLALLADACAESLRRCSEDGALSMLSFFGNTRHRSSRVESRELALARTAIESWFGKVATSGDEVLDELAFRAALETTGASLSQTVRLSPTDWSARCTRDFLHGTGMTRGCERQTEPTPTLAFVLEAQRIDRLVVFARARTTSSEMHVLGWSYDVRRRALRRFDLGSEDRLARIVQRALDGLSATGLSSRDASVDLYEAVGEEWLRDARRNERIALVPDGPLARTPWLALHDGSSYLVERITFAVMPSGRALVAQRSASVPWMHAVVLTDPRVSGATTRALGVELPRLAGARAEGEGLPKIFNIERYDGPDATETQLYRSVRGASLVHIAAHSVLHTSNGLAEPVLVLAGEMRAGRSRAEDGLVSPLELATEHPRLFEGARLVVLSACETARGDAIPGQGVSGFGHAVLESGAESVLVSLWPVGDAAAQRFMRTFYAELSEGRPRPDALREAARETRRRFPDPRDWAVFSLVGAPSAICERHRGASGREACWESPPTRPAR